MIVIPDSDTLLLVSAYLIAAVAAASLFLLADPGSPFASVDM